MHRASTMCSALGVTESGYHAWRTRPPSMRARQDADLTERIRVAHEASHGNYGAPMIHQELREQGIRIGKKRVARLMKAAGLAGFTLRRFCVTTERNPNARRAPDLVDRHFAAAGPDQLWIADITYVPTWAGFLYLARIIHTGDGDDRVREAKVPVGVR
jgi:putative transposase